MNLYIAGIGAHLVFPGPCIIPICTPPDEFRIVPFHRGKIATSTNFQYPYLSQYPSYHAWTIKAAGPSSGAGRRLDELRELNTLAMLKGGCLGQGPILIGSGFAAIVIKDSSDVRLHETLRLLYDAYYYFVADSEKMVPYLDQESKFIWLSCGNIPYMNDVQLTEVWSVHAPSFYLMINWAKFIESEVSPESQWETVFALLKAGSRGMLGDDLSIHLKCSENLQGRTFRHLKSSSLTEKKEILNLIAQTATVELLGANDTKPSERPLTESININANLPQSMIFAGSSKSSQYLPNLTNLKTIESFMEAAMEFSELYAQNATSDEAKDIHLAEGPAILDVVNASRPPSDLIALAERESAILALAVDGDLPTEFLDLSPNPTDEDIDKMWTHLHKQASFQVGERRSDRRKNLHLKS